jgi:hypothetical protein
VRPADFTLRHCSRLCGGMLLFSKWGCLPHNLDVLNLRKYSCLISLRTALYQSACHQQMQLAPQMTMAVG